MIRTILVVDNHLVIVKFMEEFLREKGYAVFTAKGGVDALAVLERENPDMAFIDLVMPGIGGEKLCSLIRSRNVHSSMIIVILSAIAVEYPVNPIAMGAHFGIAKTSFPVMGKNVLEVIREASLPEVERRYGKVWGGEDVFGRQVVGEILETHRHLQLAMNRIPDGVFEIDENYRILLVNPAGATLCGSPEKDLLGRNFFSLFPEDRRSDFRDAVLNRNEGDVETVLRSDKRYLAVNATRFTDDGRVSYVMIIRDVTPQKEAEEAVKCSLSQKELMFKELNHRVKNNLAMIASMMALQAESLFDSRDAVYYEKMQNRIRSIAMVYEWMYKSETGGMVDLNPFFMELVTTFHESVSLSAVSIDVSVLAEPVLVDNKTAVPLAMSVVELVTNALKYAFPVPTEESRIRVSLEIPEPGKGRLTVSDNGKGLPEDRESLMENSLGLKLIHALLRQIDGSVSVVSPPGTTFILEFSLPKRTA